MLGQGSPEEEVGQTERESKQQQQQQLEPDEGGVVIDETLMLFDVFERLQMACENSDHGGTDIF